MINHWNELPREAADSPPLEILESCLSASLEDVLSQTNVSQYRTVEMGNTKPLVLQNKSRKAIEHPCWPYVLHDSLSQM